MGHGHEQSDVLVLWWLIWFEVIFNSPEDGNRLFSEKLYGAVCCDSGASLKYQ